LYAGIATMGNEMPTKKYLQKFVLLTMTPCAILPLHAQSSRNVPGIALDRLELHNVKAEAVNYDGKPARLMRF